MYCFNMFQHHALSSCALTCALLNPAHSGHGAVSRAALRRGASQPRPSRGVRPASLKKLFLLREPWPYNPAAETALQPLIWCCRNQCSHLSSSLQEYFCSQTPGGPAHCRRDGWGFSCCDLHASAIQVFWLSHNKVAQS